MSEFRFPIPGSCLRKDLDERSREGKVFKDWHAAQDLMLAQDRGDVKPYRYYAKRWGWSESKTYRWIPKLRKMYTEWLFEKSEARAKQERSKSEAKNGNFNYKNGVHRSNGEARAKQERSSIEQTQTTNSKKKNLNNNKPSAPREHGESARAKFSPPVSAEVLEYMKKFSDDRNIPLPANVEAEKFFDHFESNGWRVSGKSPMKDWKAACRKWIRNWQEGAFAPRGGIPTNGIKPYTKREIKT